MGISLSGSWAERKHMAEPKKRGPKPHQDRPTTIKLRVSESTRERWKKWAAEHDTTVSDLLRAGAEQMIAPQQ
jgi:hypothetical protein